MIGVHELSRALGRPRGTVAKGSTASARSMCVADVVTASLLMALGVLVMVSALRMGTGWGSDGPESGFVPFWLSTVLIASCGVILIQAVHRASTKCFVRREQLGCVAKVLLPAAGMVVLVPFLGLYVAAATYMAFYMKWGGRYSWAVSLALPVSLSLLIFMVFERWFLVPLPKGPFEAWLGY